MFNKNKNIAYILIMKREVTYKYKLKPTKHQEEIFRQWCGSARFVYNHFLDVQKLKLEVKEKIYSKFDLHKQLPGLKSEYEFLKEVGSQTLQAACDDLVLAFQKCFGKQGGFPKYRNRRKNTSFRLKQGVKYSEKHLTLPKIGKVRFFNSRSIPQPILGSTKINSATVLKEADGWYISLQFTTNIQPLPKSENQAGVDVGVKYLYRTNHPNIYCDNPQAFKQVERKIRLLQRKLERICRVNGFKRKDTKSNNYYRTVNRLQRAYQKAQRIRLDLQHKESTRLVVMFEKIVVEDLNVKNMTRSAKGTLEEPGKNVKAKSGLNKSILDAAPSQFIGLLEYKCSWYGREFQKVDARYTSQTCSSCGHVAKENRKAQAQFACVHCGYKENADINAAKNILARA